MDAAQSGRWSVVEWFGCLIYGTLFALSLSRGDRRTPEGILGPIFFGCCALLFGLIAFRRSNARWRRPALLEVLVVVCIAGVLFGLAMSAATPGIPRRPRSNKLRQINLALLGCKNEHGTLPPAVVYSPEGKPLYGWRVLILPYMDEQDLFDAFHKDEPWDSPHNLTILERRPALFAPYPADVLDPIGTLHQVFVGPGAAFEGRRGIKDREFVDGLNTTITVVEARFSVPWTSPQDLDFAKDGPLPLLGPSPEAKSYAFRPSADGFWAAFADGSVRWFERGRVDDARIRALITRNGGEAVVAPESY